jgi:antitoxin component YwqK of YwqJK toxin-antitoxin module
VTKLATLLLLIPGALAAEPRATAPAATTPAALPDGMTLAPLVTLPATPAFKPRAKNWWKQKQPCPAGAKLAREKIGSVYHSYVCRDRDDKQHGPGIALFTSNNQPYEDGWSLHGVNHGTRWTWLQIGKLDHTESWVDGKLQGPAEEYSMGTLIAAGAYLDGKKHGPWTFHYPTGVTMRGNYDRGNEVGTWIGTREGVPTAIIHGELGDGSGQETWRVFDAAGKLTFERVVRTTGGSVTGWSAAGVRLAEYDCNKDGNPIEARFFDDRGTLARRWTEATRTLTDARGTTIKLSDEMKWNMHGTDDACHGSLWMLEKGPPSREVALGRAK